MNWDHLRTVLWLRSRLSRNQWKRAGRFANVLRTVFVLLGSLLFLGGALGGLALGLYLLPKAPGWVTFLVVGGMGALFLLFWLIGVVTEIQRAEAIDLQRLLHLPVSLGQLFVINYLASLVTPAFLLFTPTMFMLSLGLAISRGPSLLWLIPLGLAFLLVVTTWTYCLRGWLVSLMVNKRRRRAIVVGLTIGFILLGQIPNLLFNNPMTRDYIRSKQRELRQKEIAAQTERSSEETDSPTLEGRVLATLKSGNMPLPWWGLGLVSLSGLLLGALGLRRSYAMTLRFYQGSQRPGLFKPTTARQERQPATQGVPWMERRLPWCSEPVSAMTLGFLRSSLRAPETKMALVMPLVVLVLLATTSLGRDRSAFPDLLKPFMVTALVAFALFSLLQLGANLFGSDRNGFKVLILAPVARWEVLLAKNLALLPIGLAIALGMLGLAAMMFHLSPAHFAIGLVQSLAGYLLFSVVCNLTSVRAPFRVASGSLKPSKNSPKTKLLVFLFGLLFPLAMTPLLLPPLAGLILAFLTPLSTELATVLASLTFLVGCGVAYAVSLPPQGRDLQQHELSILESVTLPIE